MTKSTRSRNNSPDRRSFFRGSGQALILVMLLRALIFVVLVPYALIQLAASLSTRLPALMPFWPWRILAAVLMAAGVYLAIRAGLILAVVGKEWPRRTTKLPVTGYIYAFTRHPMYLGYGLFFFGLGWWRGSAALIVLSLAMYLLLMIYARLYEEPALLRRFGDDYRAYQARVGFVWPHWSALRRGALQINLLLLTLMVIGRFLFRLLWQVRVEGQEYVPREGASLLVPNHVNLADPFLLGLFLVRPIHFIASDELFRKPVFRILFGLFFGALKKRRWNRDIGALRQAERWLSQGEVVGIFPEGSRTWDGAPVMVGDEVYRFIHHCRVPVVCCAILGGYEAMPRWAKWPSWAKITIRFFPPIDPAECANYRQLRERIEEKIFIGQHQPPVERTRWSSHKNITITAWSCLECGAPRCMKETKTGIVCRECGASWRVTDRLELVNEKTGETMLEREYHARLKERLAAGTLQDDGAIWARAKCHRVIQGKLSPLGEGELSLIGNTLRFAGAKFWHTARIDEVSFAYINMPSHLVITDKKETLEFTLLDDSPVRWEDYVSFKRRNFVPERKRAGVKAGTKAEGNQGT